MTRALLVTLFGLLSVTNDGWADEKLNVVILTGSNNHQWAQTTPVLKDILEASGKFEVDVIQEPEKLTEKFLSNCDVLLSNWNNWKGGRNKKPAAEWSDELKHAYIGFVKNGGGHVMLHAGSSSFFDWEEYQDICCATWKLGTTQHGPAHDFEVRLVPGDHFVTRGLKRFRTTDELWARPGVRPGTKVLAESYSEITKGWEPCAMVREFGKGRCFALLLGHAPENMKAQEFRSLLIRGTEWAGNVSKAE